MNISEMMKLREQLKSERDGKLGAAELAQNKARQLTMIIDMIEKQIMELDPEIVFPDKPDPNHDCRNYEKIVSEYKREKEKRGISFEKLLDDTSLNAQQACSPEFESRDHEDNDERNENISDTSTETIRYHEPAAEVVEAYRKYRKSKTDKDFVSLIREMGKQYGID